LVSRIFPFLDVDKLGRSASPVCHHWRDAGRDENLWRDISRRMWPSSTDALIEAGVLHSGFRSFCSRRVRPQVKLQVSSTKDEELWILIDMPNLVAATRNNAQLPLQPLH
jgi:hypothetical protein